MIAIFVAAWVGVAFIRGAVVGLGIRLGDTLQPDLTRKPDTADEPLYVPSEWVA